MLRLILAVLGVVLCITGLAGRMAVADEPAPPTGVTAAPAAEQTGDAAEPTQEDAAPEPIVSANGLELVDWFSTDGHQLRIVFRDLGTIRGSRNGTIKYVVTMDSGDQLEGKKRFHCSPYDNYDSDRILCTYKPKLSEQWAHVTVTFEDNKGTSDFWFDVYLY